MTTLFRTRRQQIMIATDADGNSQTHVIADMSVRDGASASADNDNDDDSSIIVAKCVGDGTAVVCTLVGNSKNILFSERHQEAVVHNNDSASNAVTNQKFGVVRSKSISMRRVIVRKRSSSPLSSRHSSGGASSSDGAFATGSSNKSTAGSTASSNVSNDSGRQGSSEKDDANSTEENKPVSDTVELLSSNDLAATAAAPTAAIKLLNIHRQQLADLSHHVAVAACGTSSQRHRFKRHSSLHASPPPEEMIQPFTTTPPLENITGSVLNNNHIDAPSCSTVGKRKYLNESVTVSSIDTAAAPSPTSSTGSCSSSSVASSTPPSSFAGTSAEQSAKCGPIKLRRWAGAKKHSSSFALYDNGSAGVPNTPDSVAKFVVTTTTAITTSRPATSAAASARLSSSLSDASGWSLSGSSGRDAQHLMRVGDSPLQLRLPSPSPSSTKNPGTLFSSAVARCNGRRSSNLETSVDKSTPSTGAQPTTPTKRSNTSLVDESVNDNEEGDGKLTLPDSRKLLKSSGKTSAYVSSSSGLISKSAAKRLLAKLNDGMPNINHKETAGGDNCFSPSSSKSNASSSSASTSSRAENAAVVNKAAPPAVTAMKSFFSGEESTLPHKSLSLCIYPLPPPSSNDNSLRDTLYDDYSQYGQVKGIKFRMHQPTTGGTTALAAEVRCAIIQFYTHNEMLRALRATKGKRFFGRILEAVMYTASANVPVNNEEGLLDDSDGSDYYHPTSHNNDHHRQHHHHMLDAYCPRASRTMFLGNLPSNNTTHEFLKTLCIPFGNILDVDVKFQQAHHHYYGNHYYGGGRAMPLSPTGGSNSAEHCYAFVEFDRIGNVVKAHAKLDGTIVEGGRRLKVNYGKTLPTDCLHCDNLPLSVTAERLHSRMSRMGRVRDILMLTSPSTETEVTTTGSAAEEVQQALVFFDSLSSSSALRTNNSNTGGVCNGVVEQLRGTLMDGRRLQVDYASYDLQKRFKKLLLAQQPAKAAASLPEYRTSCKAAAVGDEVLEHALSANDRYRQRADNITFKSTRSSSRDFRGSGNDGRGGIRPGRCASSSPSGGGTANRTEKDRCLHIAADPYCGNGKYQQHLRRERDVRTSTPSRSRSKRSSLPRTTTADDEERRWRRSKEDDPSISAGRSNARRKVGADDGTKPLLLMSSRSRAAPTAQKLRDANELLPTSSRRREASLDQLSDDEVTLPATSVDSTGAKDPLPGRIIKIESHRTVTINDHHEPVVTLLTTAAKTAAFDGRITGRKPAASLCSAAISASQRHHCDRGNICRRSISCEEDDDDVANRDCNSDSVVTVANEKNDSDCGRVDAAPSGSEKIKSASPAKNEADLSVPASSSNRKKTTGNISATRACRKIPSTSVGDADLGSGIALVKSPVKLASRKSAAKTIADNTQSNNVGAKTKSGKCVRDEKVSTTPTMQPRSMNTAAATGTVTAPLLSPTRHQDAVTNSNLPSWYEARRLRILQDGGALIKQLDLPLPPFAFKIWPKLPMTAAIIAPVCLTSSESKDDNAAGSNKAVATAISNNVTESITVSSVVDSERPDSPTSSVASSAQPTSTDPRQSAMVQRMRTIDVSMDKINSECYSFLHRRKRFSHNLADTTIAASGELAPLLMPNSSAGVTADISSYAAGHSLTPGAAVSTHHSRSSHLSSPPPSAAGLSSGCRPSLVTTSASSSTLPLVLSYSSTISTSSRAHSDVVLPTSATPFGMSAVAVVAKSGSSGLILQKSLDSAISTSATSSVAHAGGLSLLAASMKNDGTVVSGAAVDWPTTPVVNSVLLSPTTPLSQKQLMLSTITVHTSSAGVTSKSIVENPVVMTALAPTTSTITAVVSSSVAAPITPHRRTQTSSVSSVLQSIKSQKLVSNFHHMSAFHNSSSFTFNNTTGTNNNKCLSAGHVTGNSANSRLFGVDPDAKLVGKKGGAEATASDNAVLANIPAATVSDDDDSLSKLPSAVGTNEKTAAVITPNSKRSFERSNTVDGLGTNVKKQVAEEFAPKAADETLNKNSSSPVKNSKTQSKSSDTAVVDDESDVGWDKALQITTRRMHTYDAKYATATRTTLTNRIAETPAVMAAAGTLQRIMSLPNNASDEDDDKGAKSDALPSAAPPVALDTFDVARPQVKHLKRKSKHLGKTPVVQRPVSASSSSSSTNSSSSSSSGTSTDDDTVAESPATLLAYSAKQTQVEDSGASKSTKLSAVAGAVNNDVDDDSDRSSGSSKRRSFSSSTREPAQQTAAGATLNNSGPDAATGSPSRRISHRHRYHRRRNKKNKLSGDSLHNSNDDKDTQSDDRTKHNAGDPAASKTDGNDDDRRKKLAKTSSSNSLQKKKSRRNRAVSTSSSSATSDSDSTDDSSGDRGRCRRHSRRNSKNIFETPQVDIFASMYDRIKRKSSQSTTQQQQPLLRAQQHSIKSSRQSRKTISTEDDYSDDGDNSGDGRRQSANRLNKRRRIDSSLASSTADDNDESRRSAPASAKKRPCSIASSSGGHPNSCSRKAASLLRDNDATPTKSKRKMRRSETSKHRRHSGAKRNSDDGKDADAKKVERKSRKQRIDVADDADADKTQTKLTSTAELRKEVLGGAAERIVKKRDTKRPVLIDDDEDAGEDDDILSKPQLSSSNSSISKQSSSSGAHTKLQHQHLGASLLKRALSVNKASAADNVICSVENVWATPTGMRSGKKQPRTASEVLPTLPRAQRAAATAPAIAEPNEDKSVAGAKQAAKSAASSTTSYSSTASGSSTTTTDSDRSSDDENTAKKSAAAVSDVRRSISSQRSSTPQDVAANAGVTKPNSNETSMLPPASAVAAARLAAAAEEVPFSLDWNSELGSSTRFHEAASAAAPEVATSREKSVLSDVSSSDQHMNYISKKRRATGGSGLSGSNNGGNNSNSSISGDNQRNSTNKRLASEEVMVTNLAAATLTPTAAIASDDSDGRRRTTSSSSTTSFAVYAAGVTAGLVGQRQRRDKSYESPPPQLLPEIESLMPLTTIATTDVRHNADLLPTELSPSASPAQQNPLPGVKKRESVEPVRIAAGSTGALPPQLKPQNTDLLLDDKLIMSTASFSTDRKPALSVAPSPASPSAVDSKTVPSPESKRIAPDVKPTTLLIPEPVMMSSTVVNPLHHYSHPHHHMLPSNTSIPAPVIGVFNSSASASDAMGHGIGITPPVISTTAAGGGPGQHAPDTAVLDTAGNNLLMRPTQRSYTNTSNTNSCTFQTLSRESSATPQLMQQQQMMRTNSNQSSGGGFVQPQMTTNMQQPMQHSHTGQLMQAVFAADNGADVRVPNSSLSPAQTQAFLQAAAVTMFNNNNAQNFQIHQQQQAACYDMLPAAATQQQLPQHQAMLAAAASSPAAVLLQHHGRQLSSLWDQASVLVRPAVTATQPQQQQRPWHTATVAASHSDYPVAIPHHDSALPQAIITAHCQPAWNGFLALKNDKTHVRMFFVSGNAELARAVLPQSPNTSGEGEPLPVLKISQRMRLEPGQLTMVDLRFECMERHCVLVAYASGRTEAEIVANLETLKTGFISYLQQKQACGIVNQQQNATIHIFPPCDWSNNKLTQFVEPLVAAEMVDTPHLFMLITYG